MGEDGTTAAIDASHLLPDDAVRAVERFVERLVDASEEHGEEQQ